MLYKIIVLLSLYLKDLIINIVGGIYTNNNYKVLNFSLLKRNIIEVKK